MYLFLYLLGNSFSKHVLNGFIFNLVSSGKVSGQSKNPTFRAAHDI